jgi:hypothetical protein
MDDESLPHHIAPSFSSSAEHVTVARGLEHVMSAPFWTMKALSLTMLPTTWLLEMMQYAEVAESPLM